MLLMHTNMLLDLHPPTLYGGCRYKCIKWNRVLQHTYFCAAQHTKLVHRHLKLTWNPKICYSTQYSTHTCLSPTHTLIIKQTLHTRIPGLPPLRIFNTHTHTHTDIYIYQCMQSLSVSHRNTHTHKLYQEFSSKIYIILFWISIIWRQV